MTKRVRMVVFCLFCLGMTGHAQMMYVKEKSGTKTIFAIPDIRKIVFPGGNMTVVNLDGNSDRFNLTDIRYVNFTDLSTGTYPSEKEQPEFFALFPNPVQDMLTLNYKSCGDAIQFEVLTLYGKAVLRKIIEIQSGITRSEINVSSLPAGMYLCRFINGKTVLTNKFLKY
jgi:hypothetical protein